MHFPSEHIYCFSALSEQYTLEVMVHKIRAQLSPLLLVDLIVKQHNFDLLQVIIGDFNCDSH